MAKGQHLYESIKEGIRERIQRGDCAPGSKLPSERQLAREIGVTPTTVNKALAQLAAEKWVERGPGRGTTVLGIPSETSGPDRPDAPVHHFIVIVVPKVDGHFVQYLRGAKDAVGSAGISLVIEEVPNGDMEGLFARVDKYVRMRSLAGLIINGGDIPPLIGARYDGLPPAPMVVLDHYDASQPFTYVLSDNEQGGHMCTRHLLSLGHRRIAYFPYNWPTVPNKLHQAGYERAMAEHGCSVDPQLQLQTATYVTQDASVAAVVEGARRKEFTGIVTWNPYLCLRALIALRGEGIRVPEDVSIVASADLEFCKLDGVSLSTWDQPLYEMGFRAARVLVSRLGEGHRIQQAPEKLLIPGSFIQRQSTGAPAL